MERLKIERIKAGKKQKEIAAVLRIDRTTYVKYENGQSEPSNEMLVNLADYFHVSTDYLLGRTDDPTQKEPAAPEGSELDAALIELLSNLTHPDEIQRVRDYVRLLIEARKGKLSPDHRDTKE